MIHYRTTLKKFGPLSLIWSMRFESKHRFAKMAARANCNWVNIALTIAIKPTKIKRKFHSGRLNNYLQTGAKLKWA